MPRLDWKQRERMKFPEVGRKSHELFNTFRLNDFPLGSFLRRPFFSSAGSGYYGSMEMDPDIAESPTWRERERACDQTLLESSQVQYLCIISDHCPDYCPLLEVNKEFLKSSRASMNFVLLEMVIVHCWRTVHLQPDMLSGCTLYDVISSPLYSS